MTNFAYAKTGLKLKFPLDVDSGKYNSNDYCKLLINLAYNNPNDNFYIIGQNTFSDLKPYEKEMYFPNNNVFDTLENSTNDLSVKYLHPLEWLNEKQINLDYGIIGGGPTLNINIPNMIYTKSGTIGKPLDMAKRGVAPIIHTLNETGIPYVSLVDDPRCLNTSMAKDLFNNPKVCLSQVNAKVVSKNIKSYSDQSMIETEISVIYSNIEMACNLDEKIELIDDDWKKRKTKSGIVLNEAGMDERIDSKKLGNGHRPRYPILRDWFLNDECAVYGKWHESILQSHSAFKGFIKRNELYPEMKKWKHSLCIPIDKGWATAKYLEYLKCGVSPFMHPEYDSQKNTHIQDFYRVQSVEEMRDKIAMSDDIHIREINRGIKKCLSNEFVSGQRINDDIYSALGLKRSIKNKLRDLWTPQEASTLEDFF